MGNLCMSRKVGESIRISDDICITVTKVEINKVHLAIEAPRSIPVHREEIYRRIETEGQR